MNFDNYDEYFLGKLVNSGGSGLCYLDQPFRSYIYISMVCLTTFFIFNGFKFCLPLSSGKFVWPIGCKT